MEYVDIKVRLPKELYDVIKQKADAETRTGNKQIVHQLKEANPEYKESKSDA